MNRKIKKKLDVLRQRITKLEQQLAGARKQVDEPGQAERLQEELAQAERQVAALKAD